MPYLARLKLMSTRTCYDTSIDVKLSLILFTTTRLKPGPGSSPDTAAH